MSLFDVPGWSVPTIAPISSSPKKRKQHRSTKQPPGGANLEKLLSQIPKPTGEFSGTETVKTQKKTVDFKKHKRAAQRPIEVTAQCVPPEAFPSGPPVPNAKTRKRKHEHLETANDVTAERSASLSKKQKKKRSEGTHGQNAKLTAMQHNMKQSLDGARFRLINEQLYKSHSSEACQMMQEDPAIFDEYHNGFRRQVQSWPSNPVDGYIATLSSYPERVVIADLGCGDAALARTLIPKGLSVLSYDLVSRNPFVVEADVCDHLPLPGSEPSEANTDPDFGEAQIVDVVVCALSLMGTNWPKCIREAWRVLKSKGELKIAEVTSRFTDVNQFISLVKSCGFNLEMLDDSNTHFTLFEFTKVSRKAKTSKQWDMIFAQSQLLKPCEYKRR